MFSLTHKPFPSDIIELWELMGKDKMAELLSVPLKKSSDVDIVKPLRNLIQATYSGAEGAEDCGEALAELARLRNNAIWKVFDKTSLEALYSYYDQLVSLESKIPPQEVQIPFKWKDAFDRGSLFGGRMSLTISSLGYERVCILFNMAALQSAVAAQQPLDTEESLKLAAKLLQQAAGIFGHLKGTVMLAVHQETTPDLQPDALHALAQLMLAQAQEVIAYKCIRDEMKDGMVARVCAQAEELFTDAQRALQRDHLKQLWDRDWFPNVTLKQHAFRGLAQYYQAQVCGANKAVGEQIARLQLALDALAAAGVTPGGSAGGAGAARVGVDPLNDACARAARALAGARRDNDFIYHERVPEAQALEPVPRAPIAKPLPLPARWSTNDTDLFGGLVPLGVHQALQAAGARRAEQVGAEIAALRSATQLLNGALASLNLPACLDAGAAGGGVPASTRARAAAVRAAGGLPALRRLMHDLPELLQRNRDILEEARRMLREEAEADEALRRRFGARWSRTPSDRLTEAFRANADKYAQIIDNAVRADNIVQQKFQQHEEGIRQLSGSEEELGSALPAGAAQEGGAQDGGAPADVVARLRAHMRDVEALKAERDAIESELKDTTVDLKERFMSALAADGALDEPALSAAALGAALAPLRARAADTLRRQDALLAAVRADHAALGAGTAGAGAHERDRALARLCAAADAYQDLTANLQEGAKFYNDLTQLLVAFQNKVSDYCFARKTEKDELLKDLTQEASRGTARAAPDPPAAEPAAVAKRDPPPRPPPPSAAPSAGGSAPPAAAAALPYPTQPQGMPLPYGAAGAGAGAGAGGYPYYAPMPALYNPYATLPYPHHVASMPPAQPYQPYQYPPPQQQPYQPPPPGYNPYPPAPHQ